MGRIPETEGWQPFKTSFPLQDPTGQEGAAATDDWALIAVCDFPGHERSRGCWKTRFPVHPKAFLLKKLKNAGDIASDGKMRRSHG